MSYTAGVGFVNFATMIARNANFSGTTAIDDATLGLQTNGQIWMGTTIANAGHTNINVVTLTAGPGVGFTQTGTTFTIGLSGGTGGSVQTANTTVKFAVSGANLVEDFGLTNLIMGTSSTSISSATFNVGVGYNALNALTSGSANTCVGYEAGQLITTAIGNCAFGEVALQHASSSGSNIAIGVNTLGALLTGTGSNTAVGASALTNLGTGNNNIGLGASAGNAYVTSESSNIVIGNAGVVAESNVIRIGTQGSGSAQQNECFIAGIVGVTASNAELVTINSSTGQLGVTTLPLLLTFTTVNFAASPYTVLAADQFLEVQSSGGAITIKLPNAPSTGRIIYIKDTSGNASANNISVTTVGGSVTIDLQTTYTIASNFGAIILAFDGTAFWII